MKIKRFLIIASAFVFMAFFGSHPVSAIECLRAPLLPALDALTSSNAVAVSTVPVDSWDGATPAPADDNIYYAFMPKKTVPTVGFIILPGGNCDPRSYAPAARDIAAQGFLTVIIPVPNCIAIPGYERADKIISDYGKIKKWAIGGHSVGGVAAAMYAKASTAVSGVVIWASFVNAALRLDDTALKVLSVTGALDGRAPPEDVSANAVYLPADTVFVEIEGGNHTQFGWIDPSPYPYPYLEQDNPATITIEEQQSQIVQATADFLKQFKESICPVVYLLGKEDPRVNTVRKIRHELLAKSSSGQELIELYIKHGAQMIAIFEGSPVIKIAARELLGAIIPVIEFLL
jgi:pimeloyl-ACP methyl ester carboxylesterase